ncbi:hypothetical protein, partial [Thalassospira xiamenensis]|uniref:hypothetical protein n=1 Tax=Thalassospira xiamenensis TaxID=220697 RepID=UPI001C68B88A
VEDVVDWLFSLDPGVGTTASSHDNTIPRDGGLPPLTTTLSLPLVVSRGMVIVSVTVLPLAATVPLRVITWLPLVMSVYVKT